MSTSGQRGSAWSRPGAVLWSSLWMRGEDYKRLMDGAVQLLQQHKSKQEFSEARASNLLLNLCCYLHLRSLQCGWWPERIRSQVQAVEIIRRRKHRWSQRGGIPPPRQKAELYGLKSNEMFFLSCLSTAETAAIAVPLWQYLHGDGCVINSMGFRVRGRWWMIAQSGYFSSPEVLIEESDSSGQEGAALPLVCAEQDVGRQLGQ